jgi:hypothetical protein
MWNNYSDAIIFSITILGWFLLHRIILGIKANAFNEGYKRGRATRLAMDKFEEIK